MSYAARLKEIGKKWKTTKSALSGERKRIAEGKHQCELGASTISKEMQIRWQAKVLHGDDAGTIVTMWDNLLRVPNKSSDPGPLPIFKAKLETLELELNELEPATIAKLLKKTRGMVVEIHATDPTGQFQNYYLNSLVKKGKSVENEGEEDEETKEVVAKEETSKEEETAELPEKGTEFTYKEDGETYTVTYQRPEGDDGTEVVVSHGDEEWVVSLDELELVKQPVAKRPRGRPKGSKNKPKEESEKTDDADMEAKAGDDTEWGEDW